MTSRQDLVVAAGFVGVCVLGLLAHVGGLGVQRWEPASLIGPRAAVHAELERWEGMVPAGRLRDSGVWAAHLRVVETHLAVGQIDAAVRAWRDAYAAALESRTWEGMIAVGDAFVAIGRAAGTPWGARMNAREAYLTALIRARRDGSVNGALRSAEAFAGIGERSIVEQSLYIAAQLAQGDEQAKQRVSEARLRWAGPQAIAGF